MKSLEAVSLSVKMVEVMIERGRREGGRDVSRW